MKTRKLTPILEWPLITIEMVLVILVVSIKDFDLKDLPILLGVISIALVNGLIIKKWGKQWKD